jgi:hypothetical protein
MINNKNKIITSFYRDLKGLNLTFNSVENLINKYILISKIGPFPKLIIKIKLLLFLKLKF